MSELARRIVDAIAAGIALSLLLSEQDKERLAEVVREVLSDDARLSALKQAGMTLLEAP